MIVRVKKIFMGKASVRDYIVHKAMNENKPITIQFEDESMTIEPEDIPEKILGYSEWFTSIYGRKSYRLVDFLWEPRVEQLELEV